MYVPKYFRLEEFIPEREFRRWGHQYGARLWELIDVRVLQTLDLLRDHYGPAYLNTWYSDTLIREYGRHEFRGWRPHDASVGSELSQHKWGRAADVVFRDVSAGVVRQDLLSEVRDPHDPKFLFITCTEAGVGWFHFDVRNHDYIGLGVKVVRP